MAIHIDEFENFLEYLKHTRGIDFTGYKRSGLLRRIQKRMQRVSMATYPEYNDYLEVHPQEFDKLFNTILINVTGFFRDPKAWQYIDEFILPRLLNGKKPDEIIRIWSAGCASGEEAYSIVILLADRFGVDSFTEQVKIYGTDLNNEALARARQAIYSACEMDGLSQSQIEKYFERNGSWYSFREEMRRSVTFSRHDLIHDEPISQVDLLICRNLLMYFNVETQARALARLNTELAEHGYLFLGKAEILLTHANLFYPVDLKNRVFSKVTKINLRDRLLTMA